MFRALAMFSFPSQASLVVNELVAVRDSAKAPSKNDGIDGIDGINGVVKAVAAWRDTKMDVGQNGRPMWDHRC